MLVLSGFFYLVCFAIWFFSSSFWLFLLGFFFLTLAGTFVLGGVLQAYVYDFLVLKGKEDEFEKIWGRSSAFRLIGTAAGMSLGGLLSIHSYELVVGMSAISPVIVIGP